MPVERPLQIGKLRHRIVIRQRSLGTADAYGYQTPTDTAFATVWAEVSPISGRELDFAKSFAASVSHKISVRYDPNKTITPLMTVLWKGRTFAINAVLNQEERNREVWLMCTEVINPPT